MRILFYLPVVTPWWFDNIVAPLIDRLAPEAELHVMVPPLWCGTGIGPEQLPSVRAADRVEWHILDGEDHPRLRAGGDGFDDLIDLVHEIDPDLTLCRSADVALPRRFPGKVRYMMESAFPPFPSRVEWLVLREHPLDHCVLPELGAAESESLHAGFDAIWSTISRKSPPRPKRRGCATKAMRARTISSSRCRSNMSMRRISSASIAPLPTMRLWCRRLPRPWATTSCSRSPIIRSTCFIATAPRSTRRWRAIRAGFAWSRPRREEDRPTLGVVRASNGMVVSNSKVISIAGFLGKPILRLSDHASGAWLNAYSDLPGFLGALRGGAPKLPSQDGAKTFLRLPCRQQHHRPHP